MKIETLEAALDLIPKYWPLEPGKDRWKEGDEAFTPNSGWNAVFKSPLSLVGSDYKGELVLGRRPIPESVRLAEAKWILYDSLAPIEPNQLGVLLQAEPPFEYPEKWSIYHYHTTYNYGIRKFESGYKANEFIKLFGGESAVIEMLTQGRGALWRWVMENRQLKKP